MTAVNMHEAKTRLSALVEAVESGAETEIIIARNGKPAARLVPIAEERGRRVRLGLAIGKFNIPENFEEDSAEIIALFGGSED